MKRVLLNVHIKLSHSDADGQKTTAEEATSNNIDCYFCLHPQCNKRFANEDDLRTHLKNHTPGLVAENTFLCNTLKQIIRSVEAISLADPRLKELVLKELLQHCFINSFIRRLFLLQLEANEEFHLAKRELNKLPSLNLAYDSSLSMCGACESPGNEVIIAAVASTTSVHSAQEVLGAWLQHKNSQAAMKSNLNKSDEDSIDDTHHHSSIIINNNQLPELSKSESASSNNKGNGGSQSSDYHREIVNKFYGHVGEDLWSSSSSGAGTKRPHDSNAEQCIVNNNEKISRKGEPNDAGLILCYSIDSERLTLFITKIRIHISTTSLKT